MKLRMCMDSQGSTGRPTKRKPAVFAIALALMATSAQQLAMGGELTAATTKVADASETKGSKTTAGETLTPDNIQDVAFTLQRLHQQAINVYVEATRKKVYRFELNVPSLSSMPTTPLEDQSAYLPLRKAWLALFIGTMEPLVQILNNHLKHLDERTEKTNIPSQDRPEWQGIVAEWTNAIKELNAQLDVCASLLNDSTAENVKVAKAAKAIDNQVSVLDTILLKASKFLQDKVPAS